MNHFLWIHFMDFYHEKLANFVISTDPWVVGNNSSKWIMELFSWHSKEKTECVVSISFSFGVDEKRNRKKSEQSKRAKLMHFTFQTNWETRIRPEGLLKSTSIFCVCFKPIKEILLRTKIILSETLFFRKVSKLISGPVLYTYRTFFSQTKHE